MNTNSPSASPASKTPEGGYGSPDPEDEMPNPKTTNSEPTNSPGTDQPTTDSLPDGSGNSRHGSLEGSGEDESGDRFDAG